MLVRARACRFYLHVADSSLLEGTVLQVVGADVAIFAPVTRKHTADTGRASMREVGGRDREGGKGERGGERVFLYEEVSKAAQNRLISAGSFRQPSGLRVEN